MVKAGPLEFGKGVRKTGNRFGNLKEVKGVSQEVEVQSLEVQPFSKATIVS
jgi:hypothetical protein